MERHNAFKALSENTIFGVLDVVTLETLAKQGDINTYRKGEIIFVQDEPADHMYLIIEGTVKIYYRVPSGDVLELVRRRAPDTFGELALLDGSPRTACVEAATKLSVISFKKEIFIGLFQRMPSMVPPLLSFLGSMVRYSTELHVDLALLNLRARVANQLVRLGERSPTAGNLTNAQRISQVDLARMVSGARQTVNSVLRSFQEEGYITISVEGIKIISPDKLREIASS